MTEEHPAVGPFISGPGDTTPDASSVQIEAYRRMGGCRRSEIMFRLIAFAREASLAGIRERHPDYDETAVRRAYARLVLGEAAVREVWPGLAPVEP